LSSPCQQPTSHRLGSNPDKRFASWSHVALAVGPREDPMTWLCCLGLRSIALCHQMRCRCSWLRLCALGTVWQESDCGGPRHQCCHHCSN
jgi:hypothetical protein